MIQPIPRHIMALHIFTVKKKAPAGYLSEMYLDSLLILTDIALTCNRNLSEDYLIRGIYHTYSNNIDQAILEWDKALRLNPNEWMAYNYIARLYQLIDNRQSLEHFYKAINLNRGQELALILRDLSGNYFSIGIEIQGKGYLQQYMYLTGDSTVYYENICGIESNNREEKIAILKKSYRLDSSLVCTRNHLKTLKNVSSQETLCRTRVSADPSKRRSQIPGRA